MAAPSKRSVLEKFLDQGMVMIHVDARRSGVRVPPAYKADPQLRLNLSYRFSSRDLALSDEVVRCTLSFNGQPYYCELPLAAVFAVTSHVTGEALVWPETLAAALAAVPETGHSTRPKVAAAAPTDETAQAEERPVTAAARTHLRLVK